MTEQAKWCECHRMWFDPAGKRVCPCIQPAPNKSSSLQRLCVWCHAPMPDPEAHACPQAPTH